MVTEYSGGTAAWPRPASAQASISDQGLGPTIEAGAAPPPPTDMKFKAKESNWHHMQQTQNTFRFEIINTVIIYATVRIFPNFIYKSVQVC